MRTAIRRIEASFRRSSDTRLIPLHLPAFPAVDLCLKDGSSHPAGNLKPRLAHPLSPLCVVQRLAVGRPYGGRSINGSTAISEAYFARLLGLPFVVVMPASTLAEKIAEIELQGGRCHLVDDPMVLHSESRRLVNEPDGHYMDRFTYAEWVTDWRSNNNIAESIFQQIRLERHHCRSGSSRAPVPEARSQCWCEQPRAVHGR